MATLSGEHGTTQFARKLSAGVAQHGVGLDMQSLLIEPIQRIPRYPMLIERLAALTPDEHPDKEALTAAYVGARKRGGAAAGKPQARAARFQIRR